MKNDALQFIGYASGIAAHDQSSARGPLTLQNSEHLKHLKYPWQWIENLYPNDIKTGLEALNPIAEITTRLAQLTYKLTQEKKRFATIGGDHSCAIGTWSGASAASNGPIGLLWIDAHMDSHTPETSPSLNIHGMPLAVLLGYGPDQLTQLCHPKAKILPENLCLIGVRSYETGEEALLKKLGVKVYFMHEVEKRGLKAVMAEALELINQNTVGYGISIDVDGMDPQDAPAVDTQEKNGIRSQELMESLKQISHYPKLLGFEFAEFNPKFDINGITEKLLVDLTATILDSLKETIYDKPNHHR